MGIGFSAVLWSIPATIILYLFVWLFRVFNQGNQEKFSSNIVLKSAKEIGILAILFVGAFICMVALSFKNSGSFEKDSGAGDFWRVPLSYPYQLTMIDGLDQACLSKWDPNSSMIICEINEITEIVSMGKTVVGKAGNGFFIFDQTNGGLIQFAKMDSLNSVLSKTGVHHLGELKTIRKYYEEYWKTH